MTKHEIMEVLEDIASSRGSEDIPLSYVEKYVDMLDEDTTVTVKDFNNLISFSKLLMSIPLSYVNCLHEYYTT